MKIVQLYTPNDFKKLNKILMFDLWYRQALTDKQIAKLFGVETSEVKEKREQLGIRWMSSALASLSGGSKFTSKKKLIDISIPKDWDGKPIEFKYEGASTSGGYTVSKSEAEGNALEPQETYDNKNKSANDRHSTTEELSLEDAATVWKKAREKELQDEEAALNIDEQLIIDDIEEAIRIKSEEEQ